MLEKRGVIMRDLVWSLVRRSTRAFWILCKVMVPVMILVQVGVQLGAVEVLGYLLEPIMGSIRLPPEAGIIWATGMVTNLYGAIGAIITLAPVLDLNTGQMTALGIMMLFAHALPVEQAIVRRAGGPVWLTTGLRAAVAIVAGTVVGWGAYWLNLGQDAVSFEWLGAPSLSSTDTVFNLSDWLITTTYSLAATFLVIAGLMCLLEFMDRVGLTRRFNQVLAPILRFSGLEQNVAPVTTIGVLLGLSYGGALIIEETGRNQISYQGRVLALIWLSLCHGLIEDTALIVALGANIWVVLGGRVLITLLLVRLCYLYMTKRSLAASPVRES